LSPRAVLDTNILISYFLTQGSTLARLVDYWERGRFIYLISPAMLAEIKEIVNRPRLRRLMRADPQVLIEVIEHDAELVPGDLTLPGVGRDPKDEMVIACAVEGGADYLVSGDADLLDLGSFQGVQIVTPADFLSILAK
jgi:putative PIN family toxin of toxin-antitoxin system